MLILSSYERLRRYVSQWDGASLISDSQSLRRELERWNTSISARFERYLNRKLDIDTRTEYFATRYKRRKFWVSASPIITLTSVYEDSTGEYDGSETEITDCLIGEDQRSVIIPYDIYGYPKGLRIIYTGGLAYHGTRSVYAIADGNSFTVGKYLVGQISDAIGIIKAVSSSSMTVEILRGIFEEGETIIQYDDEGVTISDPVVSTTISSVTRQALVESHPDIVIAAEMEIRYRFKHKLDFEVEGVNREGVNLRRRENNKGLPFTREVVSDIQNYRNPYFIKF